MAPRKPRSRLVDHPPSASSSEEDEAAKKAEEEVSSEGDQSSEEETEEEEDQTLIGTQLPVPQKPTIIKPSGVQSSSQSKSRAGSGSDSENDSEDTQPSLSLSEFTIKPVDRSKKQPSKPNPKTSAKRPAESDENDHEEKNLKRKRKSKVGKEDGNGGPASERKKPGPTSGAITRLYTLEDEITLLEGMVEFRSQNKIDAIADMAAFYDFIKGKLSAQFTKSQIYEKVRRMRQKFLRNVGKGENGEDPVYSKPHDVKTYEISKKLWGEGSISSGGGTADGANQQVQQGQVAESVRRNSARQKKRDEGVNLKEMPKENVKEVAVEKVTDGETNDDRRGGDIGSKVFSLIGSVAGGYLPISIPEAARDAIKDGLKMMGSAKAREIESKCQSLRLEETKLFLKRMDLVKQHADMVLGASKKE